MRFLLVGCRGGCSLPLRIFYKRTNMNTIIIIKTQAEWDALPLPSIIQLQNALNALRMIREAYEKKVRK